MPRVSNLCHLFWEGENGVTRHVPRCFDIVVSKELQHTIGANIGSENASRDISGAN